MKSRPIDQINTEWQAETRLGIKVPHSDISGITLNRLLTWVQ